MFKENMQKLMSLLDECLPKKTLFIWTNTLPVSKTVRGGLLIKQLDFMEGLLRFQVMEANHFCRDLVVKHGYDVLDTHYYLRMQIHHRLKDGIHYGPISVRFVTNLILTHISLSWDVPLPGNSKGIALERVIKHNVLCTSDTVNLPTVPQCLLKSEPEMKTNGEPAQPPAKKLEKPQKNNNNQYNKRGKYRKPGSGGSHHNGPPVWQNDSVWQPNDRVWPQKHGQQQQPQQRYQSNDYWSDYYSSQRYGYDDDFTRSNYAHFDRAPSGPIRKKNKYAKNRSRPY